MHTRIHAYTHAHTHTRMRTITHSPCTHPHTHTHTLTHTHTHSISPAPAPLLAAGKAAHSGHRTQSTRLCCYLQALPDVQSSATENGAAEQGALGMHLHALMKPRIDGAAGDNKKVLRCEACEKVTQRIVRQCRVCWEGTYTHE
jgi:hypothetical protein